MNALVPTTGPTAEIIPPCEGILLVLVPNAFTLESVRMAAPAGLSVAELLAFALDRAECDAVASGYSAWLDGHELVPAYWPRVRPKPGTMLLLRAQAGFGDDLSGGLNSVLSLAVQVAAIALPTILFPQATPLIVALLGAGISIGGQLLVNALFPISAPKLDKGRDASTAYAIGGSSNEARPFGTIPVILGETRVYPKLGGQWFTEYVGEDQYLIGLMIVGYGPLKISSPKIGETPLDSFEDVEIQIREGYEDDDPITLYPGDVAQTDLSIEITNAAGWQQRTTAANADVIGLDIVAPSGIVHVDRQGASKSYTVSLRAECSLAGEDDWQLLEAIDLKARSTTPIRKTLRKEVPRGQYDVRVRKISTDYDGDDSVSESVIWTALRSFTNVAPVNFPKPLAQIAVRIRASSQLNGAIQNFNVIAQSVVKRYSIDAGEWVDGEVSSRPQDLFRHVLQGGANARPAADGVIDIETLQLWAIWNRDNGFVFDMERDFQASVWDTLVDIAAAGRATPVMRDGKYSVAWDDPNSEIVQHFTPRNSWGFSSQRTYSNLPHGFRIRFVNREAGYAQDERIVYADGYDESNATLFEQIELRGQVVPGNVWKHGRYHFAQAQLRPEAYSLNAGIEHIVCTRGDRVRVAHDVIMVGLAAGRIKSVDGTSITLDEPVTMEADVDYAIRFRLADGTSVVAPVVTDDGEQYVVTIGDIVTAPAAGDLFVFGLLDEETIVLRVKSIENGSTDGSARLTFVDDAPEIAQADSGAVPAFDSHITVPVDLSTAAPVNLSVRETLAGVDGDLVSGAVLSWETLAGQSAASFEVEASDRDGDQVWRAAGTSAAPLTSLPIADLDAGQWSFRVRSIFANGAASKWAQIDAQLTGLAGVTVPDVTSLRFSFDDKVATLTWDEVTLNGIWPVRYQVRKGAAWDTAQDIDDVAQTRWKTFGDGMYFVAAYIQPAPGILKYSDNPTAIAIEGSVLVANVVAARDEADDGWDGTIDGPGAIEGGNFVTTAPGEFTYYTIPDAHIADGGFVRETQLTATFTYTGVPVADNFLEQDDFLNNPDIFSAASARQIEGFVEIAAADDLTEADAFASPDIFAEPDAFAVGGVWSPWQKFAPGAYRGRHFKFRIALKSNDASVRGVVTEFRFGVDVPDRIDRVTDHLLAGTGETFDFTPEGREAPVPFNGGPNGKPKPNVVVTIQDAEPGDEIFISGKSVSGVTIQIRNGGDGVARTIDFIAQGW